MKQLNLNEFKNKIITVLTYIDLYSDVCVNLLLGTCCAESDFGLFRRQIGFENKRGGAYGLFEIEMSTHDWLVSDDFLGRRPILKSKILSLYDKNLSKEDNLKFNDEYQIAICRLKYLSCKFSMPKNKNDLISLARIWNKYYNANPNKGTDQEFISKYNKYILGK